jgi:hypothetical protein
MCDKKSRVVALMHSASEVVTTSTRTSSAPEPRGAFFTAEERSLRRPLVFLANEYAFLAAEDRSLGRRRAILATEDPILRTR